MGIEVVAELLSTKNLAGKVRFVQKAALPQHLPQKILKFSDRYTCFFMSCRLIWLNSSLKGFVEKHMINASFIETNFLKTMNYFHAIFLQVGMGQKILLTVGIIHYHQTRTYNKQHTTF